MGSQVEHEDSVRESRKMRAAARKEGTYSDNVKSENSHPDVPAAAEKVPSN